MAVTVASISSTTSTSSNSVVITKPSGLAVGDLMIAQIAKNATGTPTIDTLSGWTLLLANGSNSTSRMSVQYKIADSGDVAASNFTFTGNGTDPFTGGNIYRITGYSPTSPIDVNSSYDQWSGTSANIAIGITPTRADGLLIMMISAGSFPATSDVSGYAIATSNPTWTEAYNNDGGPSRLASTFSAYATRPETTDTGNVSFTSAQSCTAGLALLISVKNTQDASPTPDPAISSNTINSPTVTGGMTIAVSPVVSTGTINSHVSDQADWSAQGKSSSPTWTSQTKS